MDWSEDENKNGRKISEKKVKSNALEEVIEWLSNSTKKLDEEDVILRRGLVDIVRFNLVRLVQNA